MGCGTFPEKVLCLTIEQGLSGVHQPSEQRGGGEGLIEGVGQSVAPCCRVFCYPL